MITYIKKHKKYFVFLFLEIVFLSAYVVRTVKFSYLRNYDQADTIATSLEIYQKIVSHDYFGALQYVIICKKGIIYYFFGALAIIIGGGNIYSILSINIIAFIIAQVVGDYTVNKLVYNEKWFPFFSPLWIMCNSIFFWAGDVTDARLDLCAMCLFLCWICSFCLFLDDERYWKLFIIFYTVMITTRTITFVYASLTIVIVAVAGIILKANRKETKKRIKTYLVLMIYTILYIGMLIGGMADYYYKGTIVSGEKVIRARLEGVNDLYSNLLYYPKSLLFSHVGVVPFVLFVVISIVWGVTFVFNRQTSRVKFGAILLSILIPFAILTSNLSKSPVVISVTVGPVVFLSAVFLSEIANNYMNIAVLILGITIFVSNSFGGYQKGSLDLANAQVHEMHNKVTDHLFSEYNDGYSYNIYFDRERDYLNEKLLRVVLFQKYGYLLPVGALGDSLTSYYKIRNENDANVIMNQYTWEEIEQALKRSDYMFVSDSGLRGSIYPSDLSKAQYQDQVLEYGRKNGMLVDTFNVQNEIIYMYQLPRARVISLSNDWLLDKGTTISIKHIGNQKKLCLSGKISEYTPNDVLCDCYFNGEEIPVELNICKDDMTYEIVIDLHAVSGNDIILNLSFSDGVNFSQLGVSDDNNTYVVYYPYEVELVD